MKKDKNQIVCDRLNEMDLSERTRDIIASTGLEVMDEIFGGFTTAEEVEEYVAESYAEEDEE